MKTLTTEQQTELQDLLNSLRGNSNLDLETLAQIQYWVIELKPKRVRRNLLDIPVEV